MSLSININTTYLSKSLVAALAALEHVVHERRDGGTLFKVGISVNPPRRIIGSSSPLEQFFSKPRKFGVMNRDYRWGVTNIYFLFQTDDYSDCQQAERDMIERLTIVAGDQALNEAPGGEGRKAQSGPYYVYLVHSAG